MMYVFIFFIPMFIGNVAFGLASQNAKVVKYSSTMQSLIFGAVVPQKIDEQLLAVLHSNDFSMETILQQRTVLVGVYAYMKRYNTLNMTMHVSNEVHCIVDNVFTYLLSSHVVQDGDEALLLNRMVSVAICLYGNNIIAQYYDAAMIDRQWVELLCCYENNMHHEELCVFVAQQMQCVSLNFPLVSAYLEQKNAWYNDERRQLYAQVEVERRVPAIFGDVQRKYDRVFIDCQQPYHFIRDETVLHSSRLLCALYYVNDSNVVTREYSNGLVATYDPSKEESAESRCYAFWAIWQLFVHSSRDCDDIFLPVIKRLYIGSIIAYKNNPEYLIDFAFMEIILNDEDCGLSARIDGLRNTSSARALTIWYERLFPVANYTRESAQLQSLGTSEKPLIDNNPSYLVAKPIINSEEDFNNYLKNHIECQYFDKDLYGKAIAIFEQACAMRIFNSFDIFEYIIRHDLNYSERQGALVTECLDYLQNAVSECYEWLVDDTLALKATLNVMKFIKKNCLSNLSSNQKTVLNEIIDLLSSISV